MLEYMVKCSEGECDTICAPCSLCLTEPFGPLFRCYLSDHILMFHCFPSKLQGCHLANLYLLQLKCQNHHSAWIGKFLTNNLLLSKTNVHVLCLDMFLLMSNQLKVITRFKFLWRELTCKAALMMAFLKKDIDCVIVSVRKWQMVGVWGNVELFILVGIRCI